MPRNKKPKTMHFRSWMLNYLRSICRRWPPIYTTRNAGREEYFITTKMGKPLKRVKFKCATCPNYVSSKEIRVDHIEPVIPLTGFPLTTDGKDDWNTVISRMFCEKNNLQAICIHCHNQKTLIETQQRKLLTKKKE